MFKKDKEQEDEVSDSKPKEVTAYEDSWYRSLKALADMRPSETELRPVDTAIRAVDPEVRTIEGEVPPVENDEETEIPED